MSVFPCGHPEVAIGYVPNAHETRVFWLTMIYFELNVLINCDQNICVYLARLSILWLYFYYPMTVLLNS